MQIISRNLAKSSLQMSSKPQKYASTLVRKDSKNDDFIKEIQDQVPFGKISSVRASAAKSKNMGRKRTI